MFPFGGPKEIRRDGTVRDCRGRPSPWPPPSPARRRGPPIPGHQQGQLPFVDEVAQQTLRPEGVHRPVRARVPIEAQTVVLVRMTQGHPPCGAVLDSSTTPEVLAMIKPRQR
ncbi:hypothetical protein GCM10010279_35070 [Streptomyces mutabilis]|nr:hypothetical protein GCM10010279_35070 [Streptomyces mutabilis]